MTGPLRLRHRVRHECPLPGGRRRGAGAAPPVAQRERQLAHYRLRRRSAVDSANDRRAAPRGGTTTARSTAICSSIQDHANRPRLPHDASGFVQPALSAMNRLTAYPGTRLPGEMASGASRKAANVSRTAAEPFLVVGEHRVEAPPHRGQVRAISCRGRRRRPPHGLEALRPPRPAEIPLDSPQGAPWRPGIP